MTDSTDNKSRLIEAQIELNERQNTLTRDVAALGYRCDQAVNLQAANAEQIKALVETQARTDAQIKALAEQVRLLLGRIGRQQAGPIAGADADLPDRPRVNDVAKWLGLNPHTIYRLIHVGEIPCKCVGKRTYIFDKAALLEWAESGLSEPATRRGTR